MPKVGTHYRHYKGTEYVVMALAKHSETEEDLVVYQDVLQPQKIWARPPHMFFEEVQWEGATVTRFVEVS
jgi:hypothetical protein